MFSAIALILSSVFVSSPAIAAPPLDQVLNSMDRAAASFHDMEANLTRTDYTAVISDTTKESGEVRMERTGPHDFRMLIDFGPPDTRTVAFEDRKAEIYYPKIQTVQIYDLRKYGKLVDQFLLLGFGSSGDELKKNYTMKVLGEEQINGEQTARLELTPRSKSAQEYLSKVELWISNAGYPLQQKFYKPSGDYTLVNYSDLKINPSLPEEALRLKLPSNVKRIYPQK